MKILLATSGIELRGGGIASYNTELFNAYKEGNIFWALTEDKIHSYEGYESVISTMDYPLSNDAKCKELIEFINDQNFDLIINSNSEHIAVFAPFLKSHILSISHFVNGEIAERAGYNAKFLTKIISLSNYGKDYLCKRFNISNKDKVSVIYNFIHSDNKCLSDTKKKTQPLTFVYPGGASMAKSPDVLYRAVKKLLKTNLNFRFYWLGGTRLPLTNWSIPKKLNQLLPNDDRLVMVGFIPRSEAVRIEQEANVFVLPSRGEGCPMTLLEAMSTGCIPIVSDAHHASREILEAGEFGIITSQGNVNSLFEALKSVVVNREQFEEAYDKTYQYVLDNLSEKKWKSQMDEAINDVFTSEKLWNHFSIKDFHRSKNSYIRRIKIHVLNRKIEHLKYYLLFNFQYITDSLRRVF